MRLLSDTLLINATSHDIAAALNYSMRKSKITSNVLTKQLNLKNPKMSYYDVEKLYSPDTFSKSNGRIDKNFAMEMSKEVGKTFQYPKDAKTINLLDFANGFVKIIEKMAKK